MSFPPTQVTAGRKRVSLVGQMASSRAREVGVWRGILTVFPTTAAVAPISIRE